MDSPPATTTAEVSAKYPYDLPRQTTVQYIEQAQVRELLQHLMELLVFNQPEDPRGFLVQELTKMKEKSYSDLIQPSDLVTMFEMIDINRTGVISGAQMKAALRNLHVPLSLPALQTPDTAKVTVTEFTSAVGSGFDVLHQTPFARAVVPATSDEGKADAVPTSQAETLKPGNYSKKVKVVGAESSAKEKDVLTSQEASKTEITTPPQGGKA